MRIGQHKAKNTPEEHLLAFYKTWEEVQHRKFDGFIITGAPIELLDFEEVAYWDEMERILDWTTTHVHSSDECVLGCDGCDPPFPWRAQIHAGEA